MRNEIVFLHGRYGDSAGCELIAEKLDGQAGFLSVDFPGFGRSFCSGEPALALGELLELSLALCRRKIRDDPDSRLLLIGHDLGAVIAQLAACVLSAESLENPARASARIDLVLISPLTLGWRRLADIPGWLRGAAARRELRHLLRQAELLGEEQRALIVPPCGKVLSRLVESWPGPGESAMWRARMGRFPGSILVLWGGRDPLSTGLLAHDILNLYRDVEYAEHERAGHWLFLEDPAWVAEKIRIFLFRTESSNPARSGVDRSGLATKAAMR